MKILYLMMLLVGLSLTCFSQTEKSESQKKIDSQIIISQLRPEKVDAATLSPDQLKDIWKKQISEMYYVSSEGTLRTDKKQEWRSEKGWCIRTNSTSLETLSRKVSFTVKRSLGDGIWLATKDSDETIYVKPIRDGDFSDGLKTNAYLSILSGSHTIESESGIKLKARYHEVTEVSFRRPTFEDFMFLLENGKSFSVVLPRKVTCPSCNGTGSVKGAKKVGAKYMSATEFCKSCNTRKTVEIPLLCTLAK
jgi:hypothetical protein